MIGEAYLSYIMIAVDFQNGEWHGSWVKNREGILDWSASGLNWSYFHMKIFPLFGAIATTVVTLFFYFSRWFGFKGFKINWVNWLLQLPCLSFWSPKCTPQYNLPFLLQDTWFLKEFYLSDELCLVFTPKEMR